MPYNSQRALELLRLGSQLSNATFREGQEEAIRSIVEQPARNLVVQRTGWGKSFVYFIAGKLLAEDGGGPTLIISPLLALMRNQIDAATRMGLRAKTINTDNQTEWTTVEQAVADDEVDVLLISPERLANDRFNSEIMASLGGRISLLVIDEAHCISDWGHDFRPHYRLIERIVRTLPANLRLLATTATANDRVITDLQEVLGPNLNITRGDLNRPSLSLQSIKLPSQAERLGWLAEQLPALSGSGIIYTLTKRDTKRITEWLRGRGIDVASYSSDTGESRPELEQALLENRVKALVATSALGMGFDKPDISFVIHYQMPSSVVAYYQQVGRAGRAISGAHGVLLSGDEEVDINDFFIDAAFPTREEVADVIDALDSAPGGLSTPELLARLNISKNRIEKTLLLLSLESPAPIVKQGTKWQLTVATLSEEFWERAERLTRLRREEQQQMREYVNLDSGHMEYIIHALDGDVSSVTPPTLPPLQATVTPDIVQEAITFLRRTNIPFEPRKQWPAYGMPQYNLKGRIPDEHRAMLGTALSLWGDAGWGEMVRQGKHDRRFSDDLLQALVVLLREWDPQPAPEWVTSIPSLRNPGIVPEFAQRLSTTLGLPYVDALAKTDARPEQKSRLNSIQQARNVDGSLTVINVPLLPSPVLLVDDVVDSGWTMTVGAWLLRTHGSGEVWPIALALS